MSKLAHPLGKLIHQQEDEAGLITLYQNHNLRYLTFGNQVEQSCLTLDRPHRLEHAYTQAMMLGLLLKQDVRSSLLLGLGGGSVVRALHHARPRMKINAIEYRQAIIDIALQFFELPVNRYIKLHCDQAQHFLDTNSMQFDLIFSDLYLPEGVHETQLTIEFYESCKQHLTENGILLLNQWGYEFQAVRLSNDALRQVFNDKVLSLHVKGGNNIMYALKGELPDLQRQSFFEAAQQLGLKLDIPLQQLSRNFWKQNAEAIQISPYTNR